jgi:hypothetical protein
MKSIIVLVISLILCTFGVNVFAGEDYYFASNDEELYGTWVNLHYGTNPLQKLVYNSNGTGWGAANANSKLPDWKIRYLITGKWKDSHANANSKLPDWKIRYLITGKWKDSQGNLMYKIHWVGSLGDTGYSLCRISNSGNTLEYINSHTDYPKKIDSKSSDYREYSRK